MITINLTYRPLKDLSMEEISKLSNIVINPFRMSQRVMAYLRQAQLEHFKRLNLIK